ncbi:hypothetical protein HMPREF9193_00945 [Treponema lecithinolyticum ATCC 700332]|uniref:Uncharacterized protein n=1 Tax=Treponema lecithinolyticum ATCC 700332 TaxID=1321815 RepID=A0ABN0NZI9_TRELE|nr:hypothetical protein HMPREF9193_00945 [Treponema lecithinolyticum ATCC 700332]
MYRRTESNKQLPHRARRLRFSGRFFVCFVLADVLGRFRLGLQF